MRFSTLTVIALLSSNVSGFTPSTFINRSNIGNAAFNQRRNGGVALQMADEKLSKKEERLQSIQESLNAAEAKRLALEAELAAAEELRKQLEEEAEKAANAPEPIDIAGVSVGPLPLVGGAFVAAAGARSALQNRESVKERKEKEEAIKKAAAEQDARNRAAAAAKARAEAGGSNTVST